MGTSGYHQLFKSSTCTIPNAKTNTQNGRKSYRDWSCSAFTKLLQRWTKGKCKTKSGSACKCFECSGASWLHRNSILKLALKVGGCVMQWTCLGGSVLGNNKPR